MSGNGATLAAPPTGQKGLGHLDQGESLAQCLAFRVWIVEEAKDEGHSATLGHGHSTRLPCRAVICAEPA